MKKLLVGLVAIGAIIVLRSAAARGGQKMSEHCRQMAGRCGQMMAGRAREQSAEGGMREHCKDTMAVHESREEAAETREPAEQPTPQLA